MARTKASVGAKVSSGKSSKARCSAAPPPSTASSSNGEKSSRSYSGGNSVCPRETPKWQKPITNFFITNQNAQSESETEDNDDASASSSKTKPKRNIIQSDDEEEESNKPINKALDETLELEPLTGEDSHKIDEYYGTKAPPPSTASSSNGEKSSRSYSGGNSVCPRETPKWQKPITNFFITNQNAQSESETEDNDDASASSSKTKPKRNIIQSDDEEEESNKPINKALDETLELEPLTGEDSHKIDEYYGTKDKGKGKGKKTSNKENLDSNNKRNSVKRDLEEVTLGDENDHAAKKVKVN